MVIKMKTVAFHNLGCKVNSYEMDAMLQKLPVNQRNYIVNVVTQMIEGLSAVA